MARFAHNADLRGKLSAFICVGAEGALKSASIRALVRSTSSNSLLARWFQVLFHRDHLPAFHLSLTVLVHYRWDWVFSLGQLVWPDSHRVFLPPWYLRKISRSIKLFSFTGLLPSLVALSRDIQLTKLYLNILPRITPPFMLFDIIRRVNNINGFKIYSQNLFQ